MRRLGLFLLLIVAAIMIMALGGARDEGQAFDEQISSAAQQLALSNQDETILYYRPHSGINQTYWVAVGAGPLCESSCVGEEKSWLTVHTEGSDSGISLAYHRYLAVPRPLKVMKRGAPVEVVLR